MKKTLALMLCALCLICLTACNNSYGKPTSGTTTAPTLPTKPEGVFFFHFNNQDLVPGMVFPGGWLPDPYAATELGDGAWQYAYGHVNITTIMENGEQIILCVTLDPQGGKDYPTTEGLMLGNDTATVEAIYGKDAQKDEYTWTYRKGDTLLVVRIEEGVVIGIEYKKA